MRMTDLKDGIMSPTQSSFTVCSLLGMVLMSGCAVRQAPDVPTRAPLATAEFTGSSAPLDVQLEGYVMAQEALAADSLGDAKAALESLMTLADPMTQPLVRAAARADDIETMRARFKPLSEYLAALELPQGFARAYCPMYDGGSNWVQRDGPVRNPYFGSEMLTCGVVDAAPGAHMDHTPRHGGIVFMAPDSFHHIEGTYPEEGIFRLYATDNYRDPVDAGGWSGRVVLDERYDEATDEYIEVVAFDLVPAPDGAFLEAVVGDLPVPADITAKVTFVSDFPEERFDFIFADYTVEFDLASAASPSPAMRDAPEAVPLAERIRPAIPDATSDIVAGITARDQELLEMIGRGAFTEVFVPALQAKELALALNERSQDLPVRDRDDLRIAVRHLVRAAWLLDWYGDLGNKLQVSGAYDIFQSAAGEIARVYAENR